MPGDDLTNELRRRAEETAATILDAARARVAEIEAATVREVAKMRADSLGHTESTLRAAARSNVAEAKQSALRALLLSRNQLVDRVIAKAIELLPEFSDSEAFVASVEADVADCLEFLGPGDATVRCSPSILAATRQAVKGHDGLTVRPDETIQAGFVIESTDGAVSIDHSLETRLARNRGPVATQVFRSLQGG